MTSRYRIIDISRELFSAPVYLGDTPPSLHREFERSEAGGFLTQYLSCCLHAGTHMDTPLHLNESGADAANIDLSPFIGSCTVTDNPMTKAERLLLKDCRLTPAEAKALSCKLVGTNLLSLAKLDLDSEAEIHKSLFDRGIAILENLDLDKVPFGDYVLIALPLKIATAEASPVRAILLKRED
ncbi:MAG: cyclase family protein [Clostridia bacterium]|nr:cyclase family protein [Clostridia bacterium]